MEIKFLNVDLEMESSENLKPIIDDLGDDVSVLHHGDNGSGFNFVSFEVRYSRKRDIDEIISSFCLFLENLSPDAKQIWDKSHSKKFDAGFECGDFPRSYNTEIRADTVTRVAKLGASIVITIYPRTEQKLFA